MVNHCFYQTAFQTVLKALESPDSPKCRFCIHFREGSLSLSKRNSEVTAYMSLKDSEYFVRFELDANKTREQNAVELLDRLIRSSELPFKNTWRVLRKNIMQKYLKDPFNENVKDHQGGVVQ